MWASWWGVSAAAAVERCSVSKYLVVLRNQSLVRRCGLLASAAIHISLGLALALMTPDRAQDPIGRSNSVVVEVPEEPGASPNDVPLVTETVDRHAIDAGSSPQSVESEIDFEKIAARRDGLFPFVTTDMDFLEGISEQIRANGSGLANPLEARRTTDRLPPLHVTDTELQRTIDRAWSRRSRWKTFAEIAGLLKTHNANTGQVPVVLRAYLDQNLLQLFCDSRTPAVRFWAMVENAAEHIDFIEFVRTFARDHPSSHATTELLFLVDKLAQASRDTLLMLLITDPEQTAIYPTTTSHDRELAGDLHAHYRERLAQLKLKSPEDIRAWYDRLRLRILSTVIATSPDGYRVSDARFLVGEIYFEQGNLTEATAWWEDIRQDPRDGYAEAYSRLLDELRWPDGVRVKQIKYVLQSVDSHWRHSSLERLRQFGRTCDTY
jgi:hypothetical protein